MYRKENNPGRTRKFVCASLIVCAALQAAPSIATAATYLQPRSSSAEWFANVRYVNTDGARLRSKPNTQSKVLQNLELGMRLVTVTDPIAYAPAPKGWFRVIYPAAGYVAASLLDPEPIPSLAEKKIEQEAVWGVRIARVDASSVWLRARPRISGKGIATLARETKVLEIYEPSALKSEAAGWRKILYPQQGYIASRFLADAGPHWDHSLQVTFAVTPVAALMEDSLSLGDVPPLAGYLRYSPGYGVGAEIGFMWREAKDPNGIFRLRTQNIMAHITYTYPVLEEHLEIHGFAGVNRWYGEVRGSSAFNAQGFSLEGTDAGWAFSGGAGISTVWSDVVLSAQYHVIVGEQGNFGRYDVFPGMQGLELAVGYRFSL